MSSGRLLPLKRPAKRKTVTEKPTRPRKAKAEVTGRAWRSRTQSLDEQRQIKEDVLLEIAARWFNKHGFHGTSLSDIANDLGITKAALYHYVKDKSELLYRLHLKSLDIAEAAHERAMTEGINGRERVRLIVCYSVAAITTSLTMTLIVLEDGALGPKQSSEILARRRRLERELRDELRAGIDDGSIAPCDPKLVSMTIIGILHWVTIWYKARGPWTGHQMAEALGSLVDRMLVPGGKIPLSGDVSSILAADYTLR